MNTPLDNEAQATELLRIGSLPEVEKQLLRYAAKLAGGDLDTARDYYQQALLDGHDAVQHRGFAGTREADYKFYLLAVIKTKHREEVRRLAPLVQINPPLTAAEAHPSGGAAHLAAQVAREIEQHPDRLLLLLSADGYSSRQIEALTGRPNRTVVRAIARMKEHLRGCFSQAWAALD